MNECVIILARPRARAPSVGHRPRVGVCMRGWMSFPTSFLALTLAARPSPITIVDHVAGDDLFNLTAGAPGHCLCETPRCNNMRLLAGSTHMFSSDQCDYFSIGGGLVAHDGTQCLLWRADSSNCTMSFNGGGMRQCSRVLGAKCEFDGLSATLIAQVDRKCKTLPYEHCDPAAPACCGAANQCALAKPSTTTYICQPRGGPPPITVTNAVEADDLFNMSTGTPGSCSCERPKCNVNPSTGTRLAQNSTRTFTADNCAYFSVGGGLESQDGNPCFTFSVDPTSCTITPGGATGECSRVSGARCTFDGTNATILATVDRRCNVLPYRGCQPGQSVCCGSNVCALAKPSKTYHMCQPRSG